MNRGHRLAVVWGFGLVCLLLTKSAFSADETFSPIKLELVSEREGIVPGEKFTVGVRQEMLPGYHTYWRNPGTVGLGLRLKWDLPDGFVAGEIQWPTPETCRMAAYNVWGYHDTALMLVDITPPKDLEPGTAVELNTQAVWMCCGEFCHPGQKQLALRLPVVDLANLSGEQSREFDQTRNVQPRVSLQWKLSCSVSGDEYRLKITPAGRQTLPSDIRFFDYDRQISSDRGQKRQLVSDGLTLVMQHEEHTGERLPRLRGMLAAEGEWEPGVTTIAVDVPIVHSK